MRLTIYVPRAGGEAERVVLPGSAIVGSDGREADGRVVCHFEGDRYGADAMDYFSKLSVAAGRLVRNYPTTAMAAFRKDDLVPVGTYDAERFVVLEIADPKVLGDWSGEEPQQIIGPRLPTGGIGWQEAAAAAQPPHARALGRTRGPSLWFKTQAGQILRFRTAEQRVDAYDHDDPALPGLLEDAGLNEDELQLALGSERTRRTTKLTS